MFTPELIKSAWRIRKAKAKKSGCRLMLVSWKFCLKDAVKAQTPLEKCQDDYRMLLKNHPDRGLCFLEFMPNDAKQFMVNVFFQLMNTKNNTEGVTEVTRSDANYRLVK